MYAQNGQMLLVHFILKHCKFQESSIYDCVYTLAYNIKMKTDFYLALSKWKIRDQRISLKVTLKVYLIRPTIRHFSVTADLRICKM